MMERRQINITVSPKVHTRLAEMAKKAGMSVSGYTGMLFEAAYAARCCVKDDPTLTATVSGVLALHGASVPRADMAATLRVEPVVIDRILDAWAQYRKAA